MFRIRFFTPSVMNDEGWQHAGGELIVGDARMCFLVDLTYWGMADYQHQWRGGISRLVQGAPSTALMTAYRGPGESAISSTLRQIVSSRGAKPGFSRNSAFSFSRNDFNSVRAATKSMTGHVITG